ncbi:nuclear factor related to kappa-B-binding protein isoform X2 [Neocloeon triangulifer]|uniref:nuclear factor related to kappa-B-binding protein isoform X2 n=1 Tax=Neocloeon triangulifer TaxID=2078957 RepID=UPI00286F7D72|nr:nuclear factor related to kappa-B-binding protein isoform X2 [Neocloeon triangulifer]
MDANYISEEEDEEDEDDERTSDDSSSSSLESDDESDSQSAFPLPSEPTVEFRQGDARVLLPEGLCQDQHIFNEFFSLDMWNNHLTSEHRTNLMKYLPTFAANDKAEKVTTLRNLFTGANFSFGNPLHRFFAQLKDGAFTPKTDKLRALRRRLQAQEGNLEQQRSLHASLRALLRARKRTPLLGGSISTSDLLLRLHRLTPIAKPTLAEQRTKRRYFDELGKVRRQLGEFGQSEDEIFPGPPVGPSKKHKKQLLAAQTCLKQEMPVIASSLSDLSSGCLQVGNSLDFNEKYYKKVISNYRKRKRKEASCIEANGLSRRRTQPVSKPPSRPPVKRRKIKVEAAPSPLFNSSAASVVNGSSSLQAPKPMVKVKSEVSQGNGPSKVSPPTKNAKVTSRRRSSAKVQVAPPPLVEIKKEPLELEVAPKSNGLAPVTPMTLATPVVPEVAPQPPLMAAPPGPVVSDDAHGAIDTSQILPNITFTPQEMEALEMLNLSEFEEIVAQITAAPPSTTPPAPSASVKPEYELNQEMHVCFFTLLRDIICSTQDQRMGLPALTSKLQTWQESPISPLNDWFGFSKNWVDHLHSAINFLSGDFPGSAETQPEEFVPYLEYKPHMQAYQWIGAGRDSDHNLAALCSHWFERRHDLPSSVALKEGADDPNHLQPPPPRFPTTWQVQPALGPARELFHLQERERYGNPNKAFTYRMHGFESVVGPLKGAYSTGSSLSKPRGHTLLVPDRPNCVTILSLVRDAVARLPNGEGARSDICMLLRDSQFMSPGSEENYLQSVVGGALDRLHYEADTCVKYDSKRKTWVYLHRHRTEEEFGEANIHYSSRNRHHLNKQKVYQQHQAMPAKSKRASPKKNMTRSPRVSKAKEVSGGITIAHNPDEPEQMERILAEVVGSLSEAGPTPAATQHRLKAPPAPRPSTASVATGGGGTFQNVQIATSTGLQTIQIAAPAKGGTSLLANSPANKQQTKPAVKKAPISSKSPQTLLTKRTVVSTAVPIVTSSTIVTTRAAPQVKTTLATQMSSVKPSLTASTSPQVKLEAARVVKSTVGPPQQVKVMNTAVKVQPQGQQLPRPQLQQQFVSAKTIPQGIKVIPNTAIRGGTTLVGQRPQAVFIKQSTSQAGQQGSQIPTLIMNKSGAIQVKSASDASVTKPMVTKLVAANAQGQLISLDSLTASQQKQIVTSSGGVKSAQILHMASGSGGVPQLAVVSPGGVVRPRMTTQVGQQLKGGGIRLLGPATSQGGPPGYNLASIGGQQVLLASKPQTTTGQNLILASGSGSGQQTVVLASPTSLRPQGGALVLQQGGGQQFMLPANLHGANINLKSLQNVHGIRVIPIAQAAGANTNLPKGRQQVFARIISPGGRATVAATAASNKSAEGTKGVDGAGE